MDQKNAIEKTETMKAVALHYRELGLSVIPVGKDKKPIILWKE